MEETKSALCCPFCGELIGLDEFPLTACPHCDRKFPVVEEGYLVDPRQQHVTDPRQAHTGRKDSKPL